MQLPFVAMAVLAGGNVRVGLEDNLMLSRGVLATNGELVERAVTILEGMNVRVLAPARYARSSGSTRDAAARRDPRRTAGRRSDRRGLGRPVHAERVDVAMYDPNPDARAGVEVMLENARRADRRLTMAPPVPRARSRSSRPSEAAVADADLVQESAPEREEIKRELLAAADGAAPAHAVITSSTSGLLPSRISADMQNPQRFCVGAPFNPVYLLPLVELCGCTHTAPATIARARSCRGGRACPRCMCAPRSTGSSPTG